MATDLAAMIEYYRPRIKRWPPADRWKLRQIVIDTLLEVMRDCPDRQVRREAHRILVKVGVTTCC